MKQFTQSVRIFLVLTLLTGILYPLAVAGIVRLAFPYQASGSMIRSGGTVTGSALIGQQFTDHKYFRSRPSAVDYNPLPSGGSNLAAISMQLKNFVSAREKDFRRVYNIGTGIPVPQDMLFFSASGLDPDISPEAARLQLDEIARERRLDPAHKAALDSLVERSIESPQFGFLGQRRDNVLKLNLALDSLTKR
ncbi:MAG TPA: potassium-transporting ATPase subunit KdpC [Chitinivibrionales bacterium]|nr:potassium-transporting ATPase subunit KdpC [Chitinivibrionales bacterium]